MQTDILFSQVREDWRTEWQVLDLLQQKQQGQTVQPLRALIVASGGCTALSLLAHPMLGHINAIDSNIAQLHLLSLRAAALESLKSQELFTLVASSSQADTSSSKTRLSLYEAARSCLQHHSSTALTYWDEHTSQIALGVNGCGRFEALFRELSQAFSDANLSPMTAPAEAIASALWPLIFDRVFERAKLATTFGEEAVRYSMDRSFSNHFATVFVAALSKPIWHDNYFLSQIFSEQYSADQPLYLQPQMQQIIVDNLHKLRTTHSAFEPHLAAIAQSAERYDLIQFSNISDWMPLTDLNTMLHTAKQCLRPGGALIGRRLNGDHHLATEMAKVLEVDAAVSQDLLKNDRSFFYQEIVAGFNC
jgi:S-adenosylmethionine-diacylglycerol 3-amino-3-carboxypropyl transferase